MTGSSTSSIKIRDFCALTDHSEPHLFRRISMALFLEPIAEKGSLLCCPVLYGATVTLSRKEFMVLLTLMERPDVFRSKSDLEDRLYGWQEEVESNAIEVHVHNLRNKIGRHAIETSRGIGYRMRALP